NGTVSPGSASASGRLTVAGNYTQGATGVLNIKLAEGDGFDVLAVDGATTLNGRLNVRALNAFVPAAGATFNFLQAPGPGNSGSFSTVDAPVLGAGAGAATLSITYPNTGNAASRITAEAVPAAAPVPASSAICSVAPNSSACQVLSPPIASQPVQPVQTASTEIIKLVSSSAPRLFGDGVSAPKAPSTDELPVSIPAATSTRTASGENASTDDKKVADTADTTVVASNDKSAAKNDPVKKTFCN
ncbi:MAG: filamentous hemagglutinin N-terminal protein, partial [Polaromonas sp.]|nr:filamentous hemagglutinin N-terminal protein [Polaromonas sp.]